MFLFVLVVFLKWYFTHFMWLVGCSYVFRSSQVYKDTTYRKFISLGNDYFAIVCTTFIKSVYSHINGMCRSTDGTTFLHLIHSISVNKGQNTEWSYNFVLTGYSYFKKYDLHVCVRTPDCWYHRQHRFDVCNSN